MVHTFLISKHYYNYYNYCRVGTVFDDALPVNVTLNEQKKKKILLPCKCFTKYNRLFNL